ncbi:MAG: S41 family peptidase [Planctomycetaceae bacterium]
MRCPTIRLCHCSPRYLKKIDERSLEPTDYDVRVRRALRNLTIALDNPAFVNGLGLSTDSFQMDGFRNTLARLASAGQIRSYTDASNVMKTVMSQASSVQGLTPSVVGFEFANASIDTLDKFSGLEPADPASRNGAELSGMKSAALEEEIVGVGVEVREHADGLVVVKPLRGGPAAEAGLQTGDIILSINNNEIAGMKMATSVDLMKGTSGSQMKIRIYREGKGERDFVLTRRKVRVWTVNDTKILNGTDVGYFSLSRFSQSSTAELDQALNSLHSSGMKSLIIDLRGNPGGLLTTCVEISDRFLACGTIVTTKGRLSGDNMVEQATYAKTWSVPLVVLVDGDSASASEIFAAAIQENGRGVVVGTKSYGKGSVQTHFPLSAMGGDLRLTTALFYSPNGRKMAGEGVIPDIEVNDRDGVVNGDEVLIEAVRVARSQTLKDMAKASGTCRPQNPSAAQFLSEQYCGSKPYRNDSSAGRTITTDCLDKSTKPEP